MLVRYASGNGLRNMKLKDRIEYWKQKLADIWNQSYRMAETMAANKKMDWSIKDLKDGKVNWRLKKK